ncbi:hypothetical protein [Bradyrhizobium cytisi]|uniref:Uncharacterized protein n=1 Tax=Bradyrhizobium cytisi TaxID=515489 RepID=A0A5S4WUM7_9BRAD|nr:hypothetical protein [Bradyrhizobium cytisi]TYL85736.1 hypothetical protein FXB38_09265 [Bradyrhizobium cytisi]
MGNDGEGSLVEQWTRRLKNRPLVAAITIFATVVAGVGSFTNSINDFLGLFRESQKSPPVVLTLPSPLPQPPKRISFNEDFQLGEVAAYSSTHGVSVRTQFITPDAAQIGASADGQSIRYSNTQEATRCLCTDKTAIA